MAAPVLAALLAAVAGTRSATAFLVQSRGHFDESGNFDESDSVDFHGDASAFSRMHAYSRSSLEALHISADPSSDEVNITTWANRLGNNLVQLESALIVAELVGAKKVNMPIGTDRRLIPDEEKSEAYPLGCRCQRPADELKPCCGGVRMLFDLPDVIPVEANLALKDKCKKNLRQTSNFFDLEGRLQCSKAVSLSISDESRVLRKYIWPHLNAKASAAYKDASKEDNLLTVHIRGGDRGHFVQPVCAMYDKILAAGIPGGGNFSRILIVTERDQNNPCIKYLVQSYPGMVTIQNRTIPEDSATLLAARHLVVGRTSFPLSLAKLSNRLKTFHIPTPWGAFWSGMWKEECLAGVSTFMYDTPSSYNPPESARVGPKHHVPNLMSLMNAWMLDYPSSNLGAPTQAACAATNK